MRRVWTIAPLLSRATVTSPAGAVYAFWSNLMSSALTTSASAGTEVLLPESPLLPHAASARRPAVPSEISKPPVRIFLMARHTTDGRRARHQQGRRGSARPPDRRASAGTIDGDGR